MAKILAFTMPVPGHLYPFVPILKELQRRGHTVSLGVCTTGSVSTKYDGLQVTRIPWAGAGDTSSTPSTPTFHRLSSVRYFAHYGQSVSDELRLSIDRAKPDMILADPKLWGGMVSAEASGITWTSIAHNPLCFRGMGVDPRGPGWAPPKSAVGQVGHRLLELAMRLETAEHLAEVNRVRALRSLSPLKQLTDIYGRAPLILATTAPPFEYARNDWPPGFHFVGPMLYDPQFDRKPVPDIADERPLVLVSGSTVVPFSDASNWAQIVLEALAGAPFRVIAALPTERVTDHANFTLRKGLVSHSAILKRAACVVCHGGPGIVHKALWYGVPVVAIPFALDRFEVARRVEVSGVGVMLPLDRLTHDSLRASVARALTCANAARRVGVAFRNSGGPSLAADLVEAGLSGQTSANRSGKARD